MRIHVLGSSAGGGFPQWNCNCRNCDGARRGSMRATPRTQSSIALSENDHDWVLFNASPDIHAQLRAFPTMQPARAARDTGIAAIVLIDSQIDHVTGLFSLREGKPLHIYCTDMVREDLTTGNPIFNILSHYCTVEWHRIGVGPESKFTIPATPNLEYTPVGLSSKAPPYSPHRHDPHEGDNIGVFVTDRRTGRSLFYAPGLGVFENHLQSYFQAADCLLVDGTCWTDDEMLKHGFSQKYARDMGHLPQSGTGGMLELLGRYPRARKVLIHINNTNPILDEDSPERATLARAGIEVAFDGMDIAL
jgi:pyrroloquinoline quinone biosynthesis protein B